MSDLKALFDNNRAWAESRLREDPRFFSKLSTLQTPKYLWIGCSDSRVPANQIIGLMPGEVFVHRNVANLVVHTDMNALSVIQYAVEVLKIEHIIVCGHYGCGGVRAACTDQQFGLIDNWLRNIKDTYALHQEDLDKIASMDARVDRLCELNILEQAKNVCHTTIIQNAWARGQKLSVHGVVYGLSDGILKDLTLSISSVAEIEKIYRMKKAAA